MNELIKRITDNMLKTRPEKEVVYRPFIRYDALMRKPLSCVTVDLDKFYPDAEVGDIVRVGTVTEVPHPGDAILGIEGDAKAFFCGKELLFDETGYTQISLNGGDELVFDVMKTKDSFKVSFTLSTVHYRGMWASDYLYNIRYTIPLAEYEGEEGVGISGLNGKEYIFPPKSVEESFIDTKRITENESGGYVFALTYAAKDTYYDGEGEAFVNEKAYRGGVIKAGSSLLVRIDTGRLSQIETGNDENFYIPFLETKRKNGTKWLLIGPFESDELPQLQFKMPYKDKFWRLTDGSYLRPYLDTSFFGKWFYALMVGQYGILKTAQRYNHSGLLKYFTDGMNILADYFELMQYENRIFGAPSFLERSTFLYELDPIGTIGMNLCDLYSITKNENALYVINKLKEATYNNIPRFSDGTFHRRATMWADDTFMSLPFLARLGVLTGDIKYFDECVLQIEGFYKRLYMPDKKLFSHIYFIKDEKANRVAWGRGNGWVFLTLSEILERIPADHAAKGALLEIFSEFADGIAEVQDKSGMWHQVLDIKDTYEETSCTGMFALGMIRGVKNGWLDEGFKGNIKRAAEAVEKYAVDGEGNITGVCKGSGSSYDPMYYAKLGTVVNDDHGTGIILAMLSEYDDL